jgi:hypothetical protein
MLRVKSFCAALAAGLLAVGAAQAAVVTQAYHFTLGNFFDIADSPVAPPISSISGAFTVTFDTDFYLQNGLTVVVNSLNGVSVDSAIGYTFWPAVAGSPAYLSIGGIESAAEYINGGTNDFTLSLKFTDPALPALAICDDDYSCGSAPGTTIASGYTQRGSPDSYWLARSGSIGVPEPAAWALMLLGFGVTGAALRGQVRRPQTA